MQDENIEIQNDGAQNGETENNEDFKVEPPKVQSQPVARVKKDLPKKKWRTQGLRKSTRMRKK